MSESNGLLVTDEGGVKRLTFNRPERRNAVDFETFRLFAEAVRAAATDGTRVLVITGAGESFCAGLDLSAIDPAELARLDVSARIRELINPAVIGLRELSIPVVARVHGPAVGIGFSYVLASDIAVATEPSTFSQSFIRIGLMPDGGSTYFLARLVGPRRAFELMATGATLDAREAHALGLLNRVVPVAEIDGAVAELTAALARAPQPALARIKQALTRAEQSALADALDFEAEAQAECLRSAAFREGVSAFLHKRRPTSARS